MMSNFCVPFKNTTFFDETDGKFNDTITFFPVMTVPYVIYNQPEEDLRAQVYQICGPLILLLTNFALKQNARLQMMKPMTVANEAIEYLAANPPHFILSAMSANMWSPFETGYQSLGMQILYTNTLGIDQVSLIAYRKYPGKGPVLPLFQNFDQVSSTLTFICVFIISAILSASIRSPSKFVDYLFDLNVTVFSYQMPKLIRERKSVSMMAIGSWLITSTIFSIMFRNYMLEYMVVTIPSMIINSWDDLYNKPEVRIIVESLDLLTSYAEESQDNMAKNFKNRLDVFIFDALTNQTFRDHVMNDLTSGRSAFIMNRLTLIYALKYMHLNSHEADPGFLERLHISKYGGEYAPYFTFVPESTGSVYLTGFNRLITQLRESGIYDKWVDKTLLSDGFLKLFDDSVHDDIFKFEQLIVSQATDVMFLLIIGLFISTIFYLFELLSKCFQIFSS